MLYNEAGGGDRLLAPDRLSDAMKVVFPRNKTRFVLAGSVVLILVAGALVFRCSGPRAPEKTALKVLSGSVDLHVKDVHFTETGDPESKWEIHAAAAQYLKKENLAHFERVQIKLIRNDGATYVLTGDEARFKTDVKDIELCGHVTLVTDRGETFRTERLRYNHAGRKIYTDDPVTMEGRGMQLQGVGMKISLADRHMTLSSSVKARVHP